MAEQRHREGWQSFGAALEAVGNSLSASRAGQSYSTFGYNGTISGGVGQNYNVSGMGSVSTYNPYAASQAQALANAQNRALADDLRQSRADAREQIDYNLRTTTVGSGQALAGMLTFEIPRKARSSKASTPFTITIYFGSDVHTIAGYLGPIGASPPTTPSAVQPAPQKLAVPKTPPSVATQRSNSLVTIEAFRRGEYANEPDKVRLLANQGYAEAQFEWGRLLYTGAEGFPKDLTSSLSWTRKAADQGHANAQAYTAWRYAFGHGASPDYTLAERYARPAADQSIPLAQYILGELYANGAGVARDDAVAVKLFRLAADRGLAEARSKLALMYELGQGVARDLNEAQKLYRLAADQGKVDAKNVLSNWSEYKIVDPFSALPRHPSPTNHPGYWATGEDYPFVSLGNEITGATSFSLTVNPLGKPIRCVVTASSGSKDLDDRTCALTISRGQFFPARSASGRAVVGTYSSRVNWVIPGKVRPSSSATPTSPNKNSSTTIPKPAIVSSWSEQYGRVLDMAGEHQRAQQAYRSVLLQGPNDEVSASLAISLAITGDAADMEYRIKPLLAKGSKKYERAYAFALAILGRVDEAVIVARKSAPKNVADGMVTYMKFMSRLTNRQKANAAYFGLFPIARDIGKDDAQTPSEFDKYFNSLYEAWAAS